MSCRRRRPCRVSDERQRRPGWTFHGWPLICARLALRCLLRVHPPRIPPQDPIADGPGARPAGDGAVAGAPRATGSTITGDVAERDYAGTWGQPGSGYGRQGQRQQPAQLRALRPSAGPGRASGTRPWSRAASAAATFSLVRFSAANQKAGGPDRHRRGRSWTEMRWRKPGEGSKEVGGGHRKPGMTFMPMPPAWSPRVRRPGISPNMHLAELGLLDSDDPRGECLDLC
jgi:hypothetical protein